MLLKDFGLSASVLLPEATLQLTKTQEELAERFTAAFYEAQNSDRDYFVGHEDILSSFDENYFDNVETYEDAAADNNYLLDFLMSKAETDLRDGQKRDESTSSFDYEEFSQSFDEQIAGPEYVDLTELRYNAEGISVASAPVPPNSADLTDIESLSNSCCLDIDGLTTELDDYGQVGIPLYSPVTRNDTDFSTFLRYAKTDTLSFTYSESNNAPLGHLIGNRSLNNNLELTERNGIDNNRNQVLLYQDEALLRDDPLLSSTSNVALSYGERRPCNESSGDEPEIVGDTAGEEFYRTRLQCKWEDCYQTYESQTLLVRHIEKTHVELKRGEEFTCLWINCPRKSKPFNARYKLLIHMRVHSGEKPNKCPFNGCSKAFSRLENLKIHQRSHTGERPYLCQFSDCTKSFSNSSDRAKHQRTHFDTKPYACQIVGCAKKYTDPSSLRKHVKNHTYEEQMQLKKKSSDSFNEATAQSNSYVQRYAVTNSPLKSAQFVSSSTKGKSKPFTSCASYTFANADHSYTNTFVPILSYEPDVSCSTTVNVKQDLKNKISEKRQRKQLHR